MGFSEPLQTLLFRLSGGVQRNVALQTMVGAFDTNATTQTYPTFLNEDNCQKLLTN
jgi:hypothetical protein